MNPYTNNNHTYNTSLESDIHAILKQSPKLVNWQSIFLPLLFLSRLAKYRDLADSKSPFHLWFIGYILSDVVINDNSVGIKSWAKVSHLKVDDLIAMYKEFVITIDYHLNVTLDQYIDWIASLNRISNQIHPDGQFDYFFENPMKSDLLKNFSLSTDEPKVEIKSNASSKLTLFNPTPKNFNSPQNLDKMDSKVLQNRMDSNLFPDNNQMNSFTLQRNTKLMDSNTFHDNTRMDSNILQTINRPDSNILQSKNKIDSNIPQNNNIVESNIYQNKEYDQNTLKRSSMNIHNMYSNSHPTNYPAFDTENQPHNQNRNSFSSKYAGGIYSNPNTYGPNSFVPPTHTHMHYSQRYNQNGLLVHPMDSQHEMSYPPIQPYSQTISRHSIPNPSLSRNSVQYPSFHHQHALPFRSSLQPNTPYAPDLNMPAGYGYPDQRSQNLYYNVHNRSSTPISQEIPVEQSDMSSYEYPHQYQDQTHTPSNSARMPFNSHTIRNSYGYS
ncbi:hypothetical protein BC833DRAFT_561428 [Globomyces pollinis-pini]|nr:hypothetical protein BC833DRAFT_561428 [Globomyces pollinis-pini]